MYYIRIVMIMISCISFGLKAGIKLFDNVSVCNCLRTDYLTVAKNLLVGNDLDVIGDLTVFGTITGSGSGATVGGPASSLVNAVARFANTSGNLLKSSSVRIDDAGNIEINGITKNGNTVSWPSTVGAANTVLASDGAGNLVYIAAGTGNVSAVSNFTVDNSLITVDLLSGTNNIKQTGIVMPTASPLAHQVLMTNSVTPTNLEWTTIGGSVAPTASRTIYVTKNGNDTTGDGSFDFPYLTLAKAIDTANIISSALNPVTILISPGIYVENNSAGPLTITAQGISIDGGSSTSVVVQPNTLANNLMLATANVQLGNFTLQSGGVSTAIGLSITSGAVLRSVLITGFNTGLSTIGSGNTVLKSCFFIDNITCIDVNNIVLLANDCSITGVNGTGLSLTGASAQALFSSGLFVGCNTAVSVSNNAVLTVDDVTFRTNITGIDVNNSGKLILQATSFELNSSVGTVTNVQASGVGTTIQMSDCIFNNPAVAANDLTAIQITDDAICTISSGQISRYRNAIIIGNNSNSSSTQLIASGLSITECTNDIIQDGTAKLNFNTGTASTSKITINDPANVQLAYFDPQDNNVLQIGSFADEDTQLLEAAIGSTINPSIEYKSSLYGTKAIGYANEIVAPVTLFSSSQDNATTAAITEDRTKEAALRLVSDTGVPVGGTSALRGWDITKNASTAELAFSYQNSDSVGQSPIAEYIVMQLDGVNNQVQLPTAGTQIVFGNDTNLYRSAANTLATDDNIVVGGLTANRVVTTDANKQLTSSATTDAELNNLAGVTSPIQTQLNNKVSKSGDTMTGSLQLPAGTAAAPSLNFTGSTTTGLSANTDNLSLSTSALQRMSISSAGTVLINSLSGVAGIVHNDVSGNLSSSLITNADVDPAAAIVDTKLATISTAGKVANSATSATSTNTVNAIVSRDASGDFAAGTITASLAGAASANVLKAGDTMTGSLQLPAGTAAAPTLQFTGSTTTGLSAQVANTLSFDTNGTERMNIDPAGVVTITGLNSAGVVHTDVNGTLSTSAVVNNDIADATIANAKLATISSANTSGNIVVRDGSGNFATTMITIDGTVTNPTDVATKDYVDSAISTGLVAKEPALVASTTNIVLTGLQTIDGVLLVANNRVLLVGQTDPIENGLWLAQAGAWTRPADFNTGDTAGQAYVLVTSGTTFAGASWLCSTPTAVIDTDPIQFQQFSLPGQITGANVGAGAGQLFRNKTGNTLNFKTLAAGIHMAITNNADDVSLATDATDANTASAIVARDASGNFSAGTITAALVGAASLNVLKSGDTMTGNLNLANQSEVRLQDVAGGEYVGINAPATVSASYTVSMPDTAPLANQVLTADSTTPTTLKWVTNGSSVIPATSRIIYVATNGNDSTGNGSLTFPYLTLSKAIDTANTISSASNPVTIFVNPGTYIENNSAGPLTITAGGVSIIGDSLNSITILPSTLSNDLLLINKTTEVANLTFTAGGASTAAAISVGVEGAIFKTIVIKGFDTGLVVAGNNTVLNTCFFLENNLGIDINNVIVVGNDCTISGSGTGTGLSASGAGAIIFFTGGLYAVYDQAITITNNATLTINGGNFRTNGTAFNVTGGAHLILQATSFELNISMGIVTNIVASGAGTNVQASGCLFNNPTLAANDLTAIQITDSAVCSISGGEINNYKNALIVGTNTDTAATQLEAAGLFITGCTNDIIQQGSSTLNFNTGTASTTKISIGDSTNVKLAYFDPDNNNVLSIGSFADQNTNLIEAAIGNSGNPAIEYRSSLYSTRAVGLVNETGSPSTWFSCSSDDAKMATLTRDRTKTAALRLASDTDATIGGTAALRGWDITKNGSTAELAFSYQNSDSVGQSPIAEYIVMQLDGVNNQVQLPTAGTQIVFGNDTNLYRSAANTLATDDNVIVGGLTANRAVTTDANKQLTSSATTDAELNNLAGVTSPIQTQLNNKVSKSGDTMTGSLQLPAGTAAAPSLNFTGSTTTGLSANTDNLSLSTSALERMRISAGGTVSINSLAGAAGVVHNDVSGNLSSSLIVNADVDPAAAIVDTKLATITTVGKVANSATTATSANTANAIVARDASGDFSAGTITASLTGAASLNVLKAGDTMTGTLQLPAGTTAAPSLQFTGSSNTGLTAAALNSLSLSTNSAERMNISPTGVVSINNLAGTAGVVHNDASGNLASSLIVNADVDPAAAIVDTKLATISTPGKVANSATTATSSNVANAIVARDASGNFSAATITAALTGAASLNVLKSGDTMTGALQLPAGSVAAPALRFTGSTTTGLSAATADTLSFDTAGTERMRLSAADMTVLVKLVITNLLCNQAIQYTTPTNGSTVIVGATTSVLILDPAGNLNNITIALPSVGLTNGQLLTISCTRNINTVNYSGGTVNSPVTTFNNAVRSAGYIYYSTTNAWYRINA